LVVTGALSLVSFVLSVTLVSRLLRTDPSAHPAKDATYHFILYVPQARNSFFDDVVAGARDAAKEFGAALSVHELDAGAANLHMAEYLGADGIAVCPNLDDATILPYLKELRSRKVPLVLVNHSIPEALPWPFVGTNNFDLGRKIGSLVLREDPARVRMAIVYSDKSPAIWSERELVEMGITGTLGRRLACPIVGPRADLNPRDAEKIVYSLMRERPDLTHIVFTDTNDTLAGTQALIDLNLVGRVQIIGFGDDDTVREYIRKGIMLASIQVNPATIGYQAIKSLAELCASGNTSQSVDTGIDIVVREQE